MEEEKPRDQIGIEFWMGKVVLVIASALMAIWMAVRMGSADAARFQQYQEISAARNTLRVFRQEIEANLRQLRSARESLAAQRQPDLDLRSDNLRIGATKPYLTIVDPVLLSEIERLFAWPVPDLVKIAELPGRLDRRECEYGAQICTQILERAERIVLPMLAEQERALEAAERRLRGEP